ncbi:4-hydroxybenzoate 3-monooxygenase [Thermus thermophilus]|uniref:4-hydroxybenzoate 3-monooxygenase n=1 Tax=Thermus thermophilus TaxID=274 RepID=A0AAD1NZQ2_THETH|nr:4-hydroxybenzoate 3-monooxygenase [Thermus thermophilus]BCZ87967.1 4-hydroxybenzoate 3-monooxygenase [Thermus thermophilus]BCZ90401.1 4-hydroxybenzoate 3-monooxygenase [Thermus thermophilus]
MKKTRVAVIGAGPAGLLLAHLLHREGISVVVLEAKSRAYLETSPHRIRAGVMEWGTREIMVQVGLGEGLLRNGYEHRGIYLAYAGELHRIDFPSLAQGWRIWVYGQQYQVRDMIARFLEEGGKIFFEYEVVGLADLETTPKIRFRTPEGEEGELEAEFVVGADGSHSRTRGFIPGLVLKEKTYPFAWLGILAETAPAAEELIYASHPRGFALFSMRSPTLARNYLQVRPDENLDEWPEERIWEELNLRLGGVAQVKPGPLLEKSLTPHRAYVAEPMQHGRLFLVGDAAHVVPPTGAKGMNLAVADAVALFQALWAFYRKGAESGLKRHTETCREHVWQGEFFSYWMTSLLHTQPDPFIEGLRQAELKQVLTSEALKRFLAENYTGRHTTGRWVGLWT